MKGSVFLKMKKVVLLSMVACVWAVLAMSPSVAHAKMSAIADDKNLKVHVGDVAPLDLEVLQKAHNDGKAIVLMFGNVDHCIFCEKTWMNVKEAVTPYRPAVLAVVRNYRYGKFAPPEPELEKFGKETYGLIGEPWVFLINKKGVVTKIFMSFTSASDLKVAVTEMMEGDSK
jgi:hypothetical protein